MHHHTLTQSKKKTASGPPKRQRGVGASMEQTSVPTHSPLGNPYYPFLSRQNQVLHAKLVKKTIQKGRFVDFEDLNMPELFDMIQDSKWTGLLQLKEPIYPHLVSIFYANLSVEEVTLAPNQSRIVSLHSSVEGIPITITTQYLSNLFNLENSGELISLKHSPVWEIPGLQYEDQLSTIFGNRDIGQRRPESTELTKTNPALRILHHIIGTTILPRTGHFDFITHMDLFLMATLKDRVPVNIAYVLMSNMMHSIKSTSSLPYGMLLTRIFRHTFANHASSIFNAQTNVIPFEQRANTVYNSGTLSRMGLELTDGTWVKKFSKIFKRKQSTSQPELACEIPMDEEFLQSEHAEEGIDPTFFDDPAPYSPTRTGSTFHSSSSYSERLTRLEDDVRIIKQDQQTLIGNMSEMGRFIKDMDRRLSVKLDLPLPPSPPYDF